MNRDNNKVRVLLISLYTQFGGGEYGLYYLLKHIDRRKFEPILVVKERGPLVEKAESFGIECIVVPFAVVMLQQLIRPGIFGKNLKASFALRRIIISKKIQIVHCQDVLSLLLLLPASLTCRIKIIYNVIFFHESLRVFLLDLLSLFRVRCIAVLSESIRSSIEKGSHFLKKKVRLIYWGVDTERFRPRSADERKKIRQKLGLPLDKKIIGFIGRYDVWKGHHTYLDACRRLIDQRSDLLMLVVGGAMTENVVPAVAKYRQEVEAVMKESIGRGELIVWDHRDDVPEIMAVLDVFVCPSVREPFGLVVLEAIASGIPSVVSDGVGALEVVGGMRGVFEAKSEDAGSFADAIEKALDFNPAEMETGIMRERFSWEKHVKAYENLYFEVLRGK